MQRLYITLTALAFLLTSCDWPSAALPPAPPTRPPTRTPVVLTATPHIVTLTSTPTAPAAIPVTETATPSAAPPTLTPTSTPTNTPAPSPTATLPGVPGLESEILGCDAGLDIVHQMGEVTNVYVTIRNTGGEEATNVCAALSAEDEDRVHPDKTHCAPSLPSGYQVTFKLTVDTGSDEETPLQVLVTTDEGVNLVSAVESCRELGSPEPDPPPGDTVTPIP